jgi:DNA-binding transcriptional MocR family regulator
MFSNRIKDLNTSPIREILSVIDRPGMISFAGGLPATDSFPQFDLAHVPNEALQYGASEGDQALREAVAEDMHAIGLNCKSEQVLILTGSQQGLDLAAKLMIDAGTSVAVESPTYLAALQVFGFFGAQYVPISTEKLPSLTYAIPTFQNPTGHCMTFEQRLALAQKCDQSHSLLLEDDPYRDLAYDACERTPVCALLKSAPWIYQGSFSKSLAPGLRLGFLVAAPELIPHLTKLKQAADLHSSRLSQWLVLQQLRHPARAERLSHLVESYRQKRDAFEQGLQHYFSEFATWQKPAGGLFFWLHLKEKIDTRTLLPQAIEQNVAFMPGEPFMPFADAAVGQLRLNFSHATQAQMEIGMKKLAAIFQT